MKKKNIIYILLIILIIGIYYYQREESNANLVETIDLATQPIYQSDRMETTIYDPVGNLSYKIIASQVKHFDSQGETLFQMPNITLYNRDVIETWHISANQSTLTRDKLLYLEGNVILQNILPDSQLQKIITDNATVDLTTQVVTSKDFVTIEGTNFTSTGTGLFGNLRNKTADILENVKTYYNTPNIQTQSPTN
ncbi:lipopolysaccharide export system protein LptC [Orbus hercynius]|uniref:Lipopolysaccharide export system protein LptC n=1 Tax=Orbus hercynius TaxID=593135 RepID=A0A495RFH2_9GAMM|nr:LPS export ABC transporter periplasmic protein LptC [Orbus hercynius]RKS86020.1 lipopolysaccharide export system protein LptC [Orbus hercynius]